MCWMVHAGGSNWSLLYAGRQYDAVKIGCPCIWHEGFQRHGGIAVLVVDEYDIQVTVHRDKFLQ